MEVNFVNLRHVFVLDSIYGLSTVSLDTFNRSKLKRAYTIMLLSLYVMELLVYTFIINTDNSNHVLFTIFRFIGLCLPFHSLIMAVLDYKSKISIAMNLEAIEEKIKQSNVSVHGQTFIRTLTMALVVSKITFQVYYFILRVIAIKPDSITRYVTSIHFIGTNFLEGGSLILFLSKVAIIQKSITQGFSEVEFDRQLPRSSQSHRPRNQRRRDARTRIENNKKWAVFVELQGSLNFTEHSIRNHYSFQVVWFMLTFEVMVPILCTLTSDTTLTIMPYCSLVAALFLSIVYGIARVGKEKEDTLKSLIRSKVHTNNCPKKVKHQVLAQIHRNRLPFSCGIFTIDYDLLASVFENLMFVLITLVGESRKIGQFKVL